MPRQARLDLPDSFYHIISRGIERRNIFLETADCTDFCNRLAHTVVKYQIQCLAWALMPNHFHLFVRTGPLGMAPFMRSLLTGYAVRFNLKYKRSGHLFQNRYKAILCEKDPYFLELVRYIHLNPLRSRLVSSLSELDLYPWTGHASLMGNREVPWQDTRSVLVEFGGSKNRVRQSYRLFVEAGLRQGENPLLGSNDAMAEPKETSNQVASQMKVKEGIWGSETFREHILAQAKLQDSMAVRLQRQKFGLKELASLVTQKFEVPYETLISKGRQQRVSEVKAVFIFLGHKYLAKSFEELAKWTQMSSQAAGKAYWRGRAINERTGAIPLDLAEVMS